MTIPVCICDDTGSSHVESFTREQLGSIVARFRDHLSNIDIHVGNGGTGHGGDPTCTIDARLNPRGTLHVRATEPDAESAICKAVQRLHAAISRAAALAAEDPPTGEPRPANAASRAVKVAHDWPDNPPTDS